MKEKLSFILSGFCAGTVTGILGSGGGLILVPLLSCLCALRSQEIFPCSLAIMLPICFVSLFFAGSSVPLNVFLPYFLGGLVGGFLAASFREKIPTLWLHRVFGIFVLWGGIRFLWF